MKQYRLITLLAFGHLVVDINQGALPAILPFFITEFQLSYAAAATVVLATNASSAIVQPLFGYAADRISKSWLLPISLLFAGFGLGLTGMVSSFNLILVLAIASGIGIAAFHPQAARFVHLAASKKKATSMSVFGLGGTVGFAIGPIIGTSALVALGLKGTTILFIPVTILSIILITQIPRFEQLERVTSHSKTSNPNQKGQDQWFSFSLLSCVIMGKSVIYFGLNTFIPLYWTGYYKESLAAGGIALSTLAISGVIGNLFGGLISDRIGFKKTIYSGFFLLSVLLPLFIYVNNPYISLVLLIPIGFSLSLSYSPIIVLGQEYLPNHVGFSSGVTLGIAVAFGGIAAPFIGMLGDSYGIWYTIALIAALPVGIFAISLFLPAISNKPMTEFELKPIKLNG